MSSNDVHLIRLECDNANAIDEKLLETLTKGLRAAVDADKKALVVTGYDKFFSAGLNLKSLPEDRDGMASFVDSFEEAHLALLQFPLPVVAAVNGHAIAGGCVLACAADLRIGADGDHKLGVSEVSLGIVFPATAFEIMRHPSKKRSTTKSGDFSTSSTTAAKKDSSPQPLEWPGVSSAPALYRGETTMQGTWYDRTAQYRARLRGENKLFPSTETVHLTPPSVPPRTKRRRTTSVLRRR